MSANLFIDKGGKISLPEELREQYGLAPDTPVRVIETRGGRLLVPVTSEPMSEELARELEEWQALGATSLEAFTSEDAET